MPGLRQPQTSAIVTSDSQARKLFFADTLYQTKNSWNSELQNIEQEMSNDEGWNRCAQSLFKNNNDRIPYFDIRYFLFDIRYSLFQSFFFRFDWTLTANDWTDT